MSMAKNRFHIIVVGNMASGKTTLAKNLSMALGFIPFVEDLGNVVFVQKFVISPKEFAFHNQIEFLLTTAKQHLTIASGNIRACQDTGIYQVFEVFTSTLYKTGLLNADEFELCRQLYTFLTATLPFPDLLIFLKADISTILHRIDNRARDTDTFLNPAFLSSLEQAIHSWLTTWTWCPVVEIDANAYDFTNKTGLEHVIERIEPYL